MGRLVLGVEIEFLGSEGYFCDGEGPVLYHVGEAEELCQRFEKPPGTHRRLRHIESLEIVFHVSWL